MAFRSVLPLLATLAALAGLAGCAGDPPAQEPAAAADPQVLLADGATVLDGNASLAAPAPWSVGDWFGVHVLFGAQDTEGVHYNTVVVEETAEAWTLATDNQAAAKEEAVFDLPILGEFRKADLGTTGLGGRWDLLQFPLSDGATWTSTVALDPQDPEGGTLDLEFEARFNDGIATSSGAKPGYDIRAVDADARQVLSFDYVPGLGWFTRFVIFDTSTEDPVDFFISARSMGAGDGWTGAYYLDTATALVQDFGIVGVDPGNPTSPYAQPSQPVQFTVSADATYLYGFVFAFSFAGANEVVLVDPAGGARAYQSYNAGIAGEDAEAQIDEPAMPGAWKLVNNGAGVVAGGGAFLWEITETSGTL